MAGQRSQVPLDWARDWIQVAYDLTWHNTAVGRFGPTPPDAARCYAYLSIAMYEACVAGMPKHRSLAGQLNGLRDGPVARGPVDFPLALTGAAHAMATGIYPRAVDADVAALASLRASQVAARRAAGVKEAAVTASLRYGMAVASWLLDWVSRDGHGEIVALPYTPPVGEGLWESTPPNYRPAIEPHWSAIRPMAMRTADEVDPEPHIPFSPEPGSPFHEQAMVPYRVSATLTDEQRAIARFWTDNPLLSGLPSGHWLLAVGGAAQQRGMALADLLEAYARCAIALHDAFLSCWTHKYRTNLLRPVTYINRYVDPTWSTFVNTPQFPEYTSGHSVSSMAAATVLTDLLGSFPYIDDSHRDRAMPARAYGSFTEAAEEAAQSRIFGGIHYPMGIEAGKEQGIAVGQIVLSRIHTRRRR
ncbi:MAG: vanadium-dependent haloperoxidase [Dermatophilaceae bacterium]|nr:vanadium-dependent haloperoxidase [Intrasporangiaceae bacterium]